MSDLVYRNFNNRSVAIRGNRNKYENAMNGIGAKWERMEDGPGWILPKEKEGELQKLIKSFKKMRELEDFSSNTKARKEQCKYHRENSENENSENESGEEYSESESEEGDIPPIIQRLLQEQKNTEVEESNRYREYSRSSTKNHRDEEPLHSSKQSRQSTDPIDYYKSFNQKPKSFRERQQPPVEKEELYSSSNDSRSDDTSSDSFPSPRTPVKNRTNSRDKDYGTLMSKVSEMERRMKEMETRYRR